MAKSTKQIPGPCISTVEAAGMLSISPETLRLLVVRGILTPTKMIRGEFLFRRGDIEKRIFRAPARRKPL